MSTLHKDSHRMGFYWSMSLAIKEIWKCAMMEVRTPYICVYTKLNRVLQANGTMNTLYCVTMQLSKKYIMRMSFIKQVLFIVFFCTWHYLQNFSQLWIQPTHWLSNKAVALLKNATYVYLKNNKVKW